MSCRDSKINHKGLSRSDLDADDDDDLVEEITSAYGWCVNSLDYRNILVDISQDLD